MTLMMSMSGALPPIRPAADFPARNSINPWHAFSPVSSSMGPSLNAHASKVNISNVSRTATAHQLNMSCTVAPEKARLGCYSVISWDFRTAISMLEPTWNSKLSRITMDKISCRECESHASTESRPWRCPCHSPASSPPGCWSPMCLCWLLWQLGLPYEPRVLRQSPWTPQWMWTWSCFVPPQCPKAWIFLAAVWIKIFTFPHQNPDHQGKEWIVEQVTLWEERGCHLPSCKLESCSHEVEGDDEEVKHADHAQELGRDLEVELPSCVLLWNKVPICLINGAISELSDRYSRCLRRTASQSRHLVNLRSPHPICPSPFRPRAMRQVSLGPCAAYSDRFWIWTSRLCGRLKRYLGPDSIEKKFSWKSSRKAVKKL